jgi:hypothetical protein
MISSDGETNFCSLKHHQLCAGDYDMSKLTARCLDATVELDGDSRGSWCPSSLPSSLARTRA